MSILLHRITQGLLRSVLCGSANLWRRKACCHLKRFKSSSVRNAPLTSSSRERYTGDFFGCAGDQEKKGTPSVRHGPPRYACPLRRVSGRIQRQRGGKRATRDKKKNARRETRQ